ncbi:UNVERIFIED_CONTAM: hypothetical protein H355_006184 [Colinus virginianus]|nr:hypothetical protein H355_006184 [Colinus virginianus]
MTRTCNERRPQSYLPRYTTAYRYRPYAITASIGSAASPQPEYGCTSALSSSRAEEGESDASRRSSFLWQRLAKKRRGRRHAQPQRFSDPQPGTDPENSSGPAVTVPARVYVGSETAKIDEVYRYKEDVERSTANRIETEALNFRTHNLTVESVDKFVSKENDGQISLSLSLGTIDALTRLLIVSAALFMSEWKTMFNNIVPGGKRSTLSKAARQERDRWRERRRCGSHGASKSYVTIGGRTGLDDETDENVLLALQLCASGRYAVPRRASYTLCIRRGSTNTATMQRNETRDLQKTKAVDEKESRGRNGDTQSNTQNTNTEGTETIDRARDNKAESSARKPRAKEHRNAARTERRVELKKKRKKRPEGSSKGSSAREPLHVELLRSAGVVDTADDDRPYAAEALQQQRQKQLPQTGFTAAAAGGKRRKCVRFSSAVSGARGSVSSTSDAESDDAADFPRVAAADAEATAAPGRKGRVQQRKEVAGDGLVVPAALSKKILRMAEHQQRAADFSDDDDEGDAAEDVLYGLEENEELSLSRRGLAGGEEKVDAEGFVVLDEAAADSAEEEEDEQYVQRRRQHQQTDAPYGEQAFVASPSVVDSILRKLKAREPVQQQESLNLRPSEPGPREAVLPSSGGFGASSSSGDTGRLPAKVVEVYTAMAPFLEKYRSGKLPKAFKALFKPAAFFKGIFLPLALEGCSRKEAVIVGSVVAKMSIPVLHGAAALLRLSLVPPSEWLPPVSVLMNVLINKKYSLPSKVSGRVCIALVLAESDRRKLHEVLRVHHHDLVGPEIRRELLTRNPAAVLEQQALLLEKRQQRLEQQEDSKMDVTVAATMMEVDG